MNKRWQELASLIGFVGIFVACGVGEKFIPLIG